MTTALDLTNSLAIDAKGVGDLRLLAKQDKTQGARAAARQFEALFLNMMLKSMRDAIPMEGLFDDSNTKLYTEMMDSQLSQSLSKSGGVGLADFIIKQMQQQGVIPGETPVSPVAKPKMADAHFTARLNPLLSLNPQTIPPLHEADALESSTKPHTVSSSKSTSAGGFVDSLWTHAVEAAQQLGIPAHFLLGQAALESGWGKHEILGANGQNSHNLFGIKAGKSWTGASVEVATTEYVNGVAQKKLEKFRSYDSYADAFKDYARLLKDNPRYSGLFEQNLDAAGFAKGLQKAGYATDPAYADKLTRVINSNAMRQALA